MSELFSTPTTAEINPRQSCERKEGEKINGVAKNILVEKVELDSNCGAIFL